jgi:DNA-binding GntR family transcriptional regulator
MPRPLPSQDRQQSASEYVVQALRESIRQGQLAPGSALKQDELAEQFNVSHIPVREALRRLEADGLVVVHRNRGAFVAELSEADICEVFDIRVALEGAALRLAVPRLCKNDLKEADRHLKAMRRTKDRSIWLAHDMEFHLGLYRAAQSPRMLGMIENLRAHTDRYHFAFISLIESATITEHENLEHTQIFEACERGEVRNACRALETHLEHSAKLVLGYLHSTGLLTVEP